MPYHIYCCATMCYMALHCLKKKTFFHATPFLINILIFKRKQYKQKYKRKIQFATKKKV